MNLVFWLCFAAVLYSYLIYPLALQVLSWVFELPAPKGHKSSRPPRVSLIFAIFNEEDVLEEKLINCTELEYAENGLEVLIGSDASDDKTSEILAAHASSGIFRVFEYSERRGKSAVLNRLVEEARGEILIFCDANTMLLKNAVQRLVNQFSDGKTGAVCGRLILKDSNKISLSQGESLYWRIESEIKDLEGRMGIVMGANGGLYGLRRELYTPIPEHKTVMDDFYVTTRVLAQGFHVRYDALAIGTEDTSADPYGEFKRKIRIGEANYNMLGAFIPLLNPLRPLVAFSFFSHKLLRWATPVFLIFIALTNIYLLHACPESSAYWALFTLQAAGYLAAYAGFRRNKTGRKANFLAGAAFYFISMNLALFLGLVKSIFGQKKGSWERIKRG